MYSTCRGEDCIKAKGALWVRLGVNAVHTQHTFDLAGSIGGPLTNDCVENVRGAGCREPPSSEAYIDVFTTHLQASSPVFCDLETHEDIAAAAYPYLDSGGVWASSLFQSAFFCDALTDSAVQRAQLDELDAFVDGVMAASPDRQAILAGDFNIDGQNLNGADPLSSYGDMLARLGLLASGMATDPAPDDSLIGAGTDFAWDLEHADLAREVITDWSTGTGTDIGLASVRQADGAMPDLIDRDLLGPLVGTPDGVERFDYLFVRPPDSFAGGGHLLARTTGPIYASPWPNADGLPPFDPPSRRFSDHKPVEASFRVLFLRHAGAYVGDVLHDYSFRVTSVNATGEDDCWLDFCSPLDLVIRGSAEHVLSAGSGAHLPGSPLSSTECSGWSLNRVSDPCMADWQYVDAQDPAVHVETRAGALLVDDDGSEPDDYYPTVPSIGDHPWIWFEWATGMARGRGYYSHAEMGDGWMDHAVQTNDPIRHCTDDRPVNLCFEVSFDEAAP